MSDTVGGPALHAICRSAATAVPPSPYFSADAVSRPQLKKTRSGPSSRGGRCGRLFQLSEKPARCLVHIGNTLERRLLHVSVLLCLAGSAGLCWPVISQFRSTVWVSSAEASIDPPVSRCLRFSRCHGKAEVGMVKLDPFSSSTYAPAAKPRVMAKVRTRAWPRDRPKRDGACMEPIAEKERAARSRGGETRGQPTETEPEASRPACVTRG